MSDTAAAVPAIGPPFEPVETVNGKKATSFLDQYLALSPAMSLYEFAAIVQPMGPMAVPVLSCPFTHSVPHLGVSRSRGCGCAGGGCGCAGGGAGALAGCGCAGGDAGALAVVRVLCVAPSLAQR